MGNDQIPSVPDSSTDGDSYTHEESRTDEYSHIHDDPYIHEDLYTHEEPYAHEDSSYTDEGYYTDEGSYTLDDSYTRDDSYALGEVYSNFRQGMTPESASDLLSNGAHIDSAGGPDGETVWHAVVKYQEEPIPMLEWLDKHSSVLCDETKSNGDSPLMLAIHLGKFETLKWLSWHSDLRLVNPVRQLTAPEIAARSEGPESREMLEIMAESMEELENWKELKDRIDKAICHSLEYRTRHLTVSMHVYCESKLCAERPCVDLNKRLQEVQGLALQKWELLERILGNQVNHT
ncbi:hypothetical protein N7470_000597 [Penicillium chermesinum]|nr:hypothetical protein N7470_000597 [Penicillium chermesinum]